MIDSQVVVPNLPDDLRRVLSTWGRSCMPMLMYLPDYMTRATGSVSGEELVYRRAV